MTYKIGVMSDVHYRLGENTRTDIIDSLVELFTSESVDLTLSLADLIDDNTDRADSQAQIAALTPHFPSGSKWVIGNHDISNTSLANFLIDAAAFTPGQNFYVDLGDWRLLCIDNVSGFRWSADATTLQWLEDELESARVAGKYIAVASHAPFSLDWPGAMAQLVYDPVYGAGAATASALDGTVTITTDEDAFAVDDVGNVIALQHIDATVEYFGRGTITTFNNARSVNISTSQPFHSTGPADAWIWVTGYDLGGYSTYSYNGQKIREKVDTAVSAGADVKFCIYGHNHVNRHQTVAGVEYYAFTTSGKDDSGSGGIITLNDDGSFFLSGIKLQTSYNNQLWYLDADNGDDDNGGALQGDAWATVSKLLSHGGVAGDTVYFLPGIYRESAYMSDSGISGNPITWRFADGAKLCGADIVAGFSGPDGNGWYTKASVTTEVKTVLEDGAALTEGDYSVSAVAGTWDWNADTLYYCPTSGIPSGHIVDAGQRNNGITLNDNEYVEVLSPVCYGFNNSAIGTSGVPENILIKNPECYGNNYGISFLDVLGSGNRVVNPVCHHNSINGIRCGGSTRVSIENFNVFENYKGLSIDSLSQPEIKTGVAANNTYDGINLYLNSTAVAFKNIITYGNARRGYTAGGTGVSSIANSCLNDTVVLGNTTTSNVITDDPLFADPNNNDFHLQPTSPCIGVGVDAGLVSDIEGNQLYSPYNIGPYGAATGALTKSPSLYIGRAKYSFGVISGTGPSDWVLTAPEAPELIAYLGVDNTIYDIDGSAKEISYLTFLLICDDIQLFGGSKGFAFYSSDMSAYSEKIHKIIGDQYTTDGVELIANSAFEGTYVAGVAPSFAKSGAPTVAEAAGVTGSAQQISNGSTSDIVQQNIQFVSGQSYLLRCSGKRSAGTGKVAVRLLSAVIGVSTDVIEFSTASFEEKAYIITSIATTTSPVRLYAGGSTTGIFDNLSLQKLV